MILAVLFDLDGTLLDTAADLVGALNFVRAEEGLPELPVADLRHMVSKGAIGLIEAGMPASDGSVLEARRASFLEFYAANSTRHTRPFDGVPELLQFLSARAIPWGVVTNKPEYLTLPILDSMGFLPAAACVICGDTLADKKPHPAPIELACEIIGAQAADTLMVGDDIRDMEAGEAAGTRTAFAAYGYVWPPVEQLDLSRSVVVEHPGELRDLIARQPRTP